VAEDRSTGGMIVDVLMYLLARLALVAGLSAVIFFGAHVLGISDFPLVVGVLFAIVIAPVYRNLLRFQAAISPTSSAPRHFCGRRPVRRWEFRR